MGLAIGEVVSIVRWSKWWFQHYIWDNTVEGILRMGNNGPVSEVVRK